MTRDGQPDDGSVALWRDWQAGDRVVVRYRIEHADGGPRHTDALGYVVAASAAGVTVRTRTGDVVIPAAAIALGKRVPPPPRPRGARG